MLGNSTLINVGYNLSMRHSYLADDWLGYIEKIKEAKICGWTAV